MEKTYTARKMLNVFNSDYVTDTILKADRAGTIPKPIREQAGATSVRRWRTQDLPQIGERYGFLRKTNVPRCVAVFTTKGGVLKTSVSMNLARIAALHNIKTCVVGLDMQGDITSALGALPKESQADSLEEAISKVNEVSGLMDVFSGKRSIESVLYGTDIDPLCFIPETSDLVALDKALSLKQRREYWLLEKVVRPLQKKFDLVVLDCSPNWNHLITNAIVACDLLISPIECRINQFRNLQVFMEFMKEFKEEMGIQFQHIYVPTRFVSTRKLSSEIRGWYIENIKGLTHGCIRESVQGEEAMASNISLPEYAPTSICADEMRELVKELWSFLEAQSVIETPRIAKNVVAASKRHRSVAAAPKKNGAEAPA